ncbi:MAG: thermonuclease family protein [Patescibacteria group bacterium]
MKKVLLLFFGLLVLAFAFLGFLPPEAAAPLPQSQAADVATVMNADPTPPLPPNTHSVLKVIDGDTISIIKEGRPVTLRLIGLDTPETVDPRRPVQCFGKAASDKAKGLLAGKTVLLEFDATQGMYDKYGRTLAYIFLSDGTLFNRYMIAEGYGHEYTYNLPYKYQNEFKEAERRAREEKKGLWADGTCAGDTKKAAAS